MGSRRGSGVGAVRDGGQASPLLLVVLLVAALAALCIAQWGVVVVDRARARTAADAAALAAVGGGRRAADAIATANGGALEAFAEADNTAQVTVRVGRARATARARPVDVATSLGRFGEPVRRRG